MGTNLINDIIIVVVASLLGGIGTLIWSLINTLRRMSSSIADLVADFRVFTTQTEGRESTQKLICATHRINSEGKIKNIEADIEEIKTTFAKKRTILK